VNGLAGIDDATWVWIGVALFVIAVIIAFAGRRK
jgi:hypothetical protein